MMRPPVRSDGRDSSRPSGPRTVPRPKDRDACAPDGRRERRPSDRGPGPVIDHLGPRIPSRAVPPTGRRLVVAALALATAAGLTLAALPGCARLTHRPLPPGDEAADERSTGIRYHPSAPYLLVYSDGQGGLVSRILELPDTSCTVVAEPRCFLAELRAKLEFRDGVLTDALGAPDSRALPAAVLEAADGIARQAADALRSRNAARPSASRPRSDDAMYPSGDDLDDDLEALFPAPCLFRIEVHGNDLDLIGGPGDEPVRITLRRKSG